jgi:capsular exopolysaccharide synthesis family protein
VDLRDYLRAARHRWWLVLGVLALAIGAAAAVTAHTTPRYATTMTFFVTTPHDGISDAYQGGLFSQQRVKSYADLLTSDRLAAAVASSIGGGRRTADVRGRISAEPIPDTVLLQATVVHPSRAESRRIGWGVGREFKRLVEDLETPPGGKAPAVKVEVIAGPRLQPEPVTPRPLRNYGLAAVLGLLAGLGAAVLRELLDTTVKTAETLRGVVESPVLGAIPYDPATRKAPLILRHAAGTGPGGAPGYGVGPGSARAEALRQIRTNLRFIGVDRPVETIVLTSALPNEGKSSTSANLAIVLAEAGRRVLLVDADLRRPRLATYLGLEGAVGLANVLVGQVGVDDVIQPWGPAGLDVLASGFVPPNPSELLGCAHMGDLLRELGERYDTVLIDAPPLLPVTDAAVLAGRADGALLIVRRGKTSQTQVRAAAQALEAVDARLLGTVLNMVPTKGRSGYYHHYGYGPRAASGARWAWVRGGWRLLARGVSGVARGAWRVVRGGWRLLARGASGVARGASGVARGVWRACDSGARWLGVRPGPEPVVPPGPAAVPPADAATVAAASTGGQVSSNGARQSSNGDRPAAAPVSPPPARPPVTVPDRSPRVPE